jgi:hypothetical protein
LIWEVKIADEPALNLQTGFYYAFVIAAENVIGEGEHSNSRTMAMAMQANIPTQPTVDRAFSSLISLNIKWTEGSAGDINILGYKLYMIELETGDVTLEYNGSKNPDILQFTIPNLITNAYYSVYVVAVDFNGVSLESEESVFVVCL